MSPQPWGTVHGRMVGRAPSFPRWDDASSLAPKNCEAESICVVRSASILSVVFAESCEVPAGSVSTRRCAGEEFSHRLNASCVLVLPASAEAAQLECWAPCVWQTLIIFSIA